MSCSSKFELKGPSFIFVALVVLAAPSAHALLLLRGHFGLHSVSSSEIDSNVASEYKVKSMTGYGGDLMITPTAFPIGLGVRYETQSQKLSSSGLEYTYTADRWAIIGERHLIDTGVYMGVVATYGVSHNSVYSVDTPVANTSFKYTTTTASSWSAGLAVGLKLMMWRLGLEGGYLSYVATDFKDSNGAALAGNPKADYSGGYGKALIGVEF